MGFYLRKSFGLGPLRLNLSKSGFGLSAGVTGARFGVSSSGRAYVHAGRGGLYYRKYLGSGQEAREPGRASGPVTLYEDTGVTYQPRPVSASEPRYEEALVRRKPSAGPYLLMPLGGLLLLALGGDGPVSLLGVIVLLAGPLLIWRLRRRHRAADRLGEVLARAFGARRPLDPSTEREIQEALADERLAPEDRGFEIKKAYLGLTAGIVEDRRTTPEELQLLDQAERLLELPPEFIAGVRADAFRAAYLEAVADHDLSASEERALHHIRQELGIPDEEIARELETVQRLREVRKIREGSLPVVQPGAPLRQSETCHDESPARLLKEKNLKSFQRAGQRYKVRGLVIDKEGTLFITNKRLLLVHRGTTSIRLNKILDLEVDYDQNLLMITKDGRRSPVMITTPDAMKSAAIAAAVAGL